MKNERRYNPTMTRRSVLATFCLLLGAGSIYWVWKATEPDRRYDAIRQLVMRYRGKLSGAWTPDDEKKLWRNLSWFGKSDPEKLTHRMIASVGSDDPLERELGIVLMRQVHVSGNYGLSSFVFPYILPNPSESGTYRPIPCKLDRAIRANSTLIARLATDESRVTRDSFLQVVSLVEAGVFRETVIYIALHDPDPRLRVDAVYLLDFLGPSPSMLRTLHDLLKDDLAPVRLSAAASLAGLEDRDGIREYCRLLNDPGKGLTGDDWVEAIVQLHLRLRDLAPDLVDETSPLLKSDPPLAARKWGDWLKAQRYGE
jgi:hypothetical protein